MPGELDHGPACGCEDPKWIGNGPHLDFNAEVQKFRADPFAYEYPFQHGPEPGMNLRQQVELTAIRYGWAFTFPIWMGLRDKFDPEF